MSKCRITVMKQYYDEELADRYIQGCPGRELVPCRFFSQIGQSFVIDSSMEMPDGFCPYAWESAIDKYAFAMVHGGGGFFGGTWMKNESEMITCCPDGIRPVVFHLQRLDEES